MNYEVGDSRFVEVNNLWTNMRPVFYRISMPAWLKKNSGFSAGLMVTEHLPCCQGNLVVFVLVVET